VGLYFAWRHRLRAAVVPIAVAAAILLVFAAGPIFGLPLIGRYVRTPAILLTLFYGLAVMAWQMLPRGDERRRWTWVGAAVALFSVIYLPWHVKKLDDLRDRTHDYAGLYSDLRTASRAPAVRAAFDSCGQKISTSDHRPIPYVRYWLHSGPRSVGTIEKRATPLSQLVITPRRTREARRFYRANYPRYTPPAGWRTLYENRSWRVYAAPGCGPAA
jgi:hypothetical protein